MKQYRNRPVISFFFLLNGNDLLNQALGLPVYLQPHIRCVRPTPSYTMPENKHTSGQPDNAAMATGGSSRRFWGRPTWRSDPSQGTPKTKNSSDLAHYFWGVAQNHVQK